MRKVKEVTEEWRIQYDTYFWRDDESRDREIARTNKVHEELTRVRAERDTALEALTLVSKAVSPQGVVVHEAVSEAVETLLQGQELHTHVHCSSDGKPAIHLARRSE